MTTEPSTIWKDGTAEGSQMWIMASIPGKATKMKMREARYRWTPNGRPCSRSSTVRRGRENSPLLGSPFLWCARQWDSDVPSPPARGFTLVLGRKAGTRRKPGLGPLHQPWKRSMARSLWICPRRAGPEAEEKQEDDQGGQADRKTDRRGGGWGKGGTTGRGRPQQAR